MNLDLDALQLAAEAATPGPWHVDLLPTDDLHAVRHAHGIVADVGYSGSVRRDMENATFIAAANPAAVLELVRRLKTADIDADWSRTIMDSARSNQLDLLERLDAAEEKHHARLAWLAARGAVIEPMIVARQTGDVSLWYVAESAPVDGPHPHNADPRRLYGESDVSIEAAIDNAMKRQAAGKDPYYV